MGLFSWLFGGKNAKKPAASPEPLVLGAKLRCPYSNGGISYLYVESQNIDINNLPEACVTDCIPATEAKRNILPFAQCLIGECSQTMKFTDIWVNPEPQRKLVNGKEIITKNSILICERANAPLEILTSGQDGDFANYLLLINHMDEAYPGLRSILDDPHGSLYLNEGMYEIALQFLEERIKFRTTPILTASLADEKPPDNAYILAALDRLLPYFNANQSDKFISSFENMLVRVNASGSADVTNFDLALWEKIRMDCEVINKQVQSGGVYRFQETYKSFLNWAGTSMEAMSYAMMFYAMATERKQETAKEKTKEVDKEKVEGKTGEGTATTTGQTRVGRWMSQAEYEKMVETGQLQMSGDNKLHVANPANIEAFGKQAPNGSIYVEFDVPSNTVFPGGKEGWGIIAGPGSLQDRLNAQKGLPRITEMPKATNIESSLGNAINN